MSGSRAEWAAVIGAAQRVMNVATAVQDAAIARLAAIEVEWLEDGTEVERDRGPGHVALDAPAIVSGSWRSRRCTPSVAWWRRCAWPVTTRRTRGRRGGERARGPARGDAPRPLDAYRAAVVADELAEAPPQVAACVVAAVEGHFGTEDGAHLRRRCRRVLARISPDLLVERAAGAGRVRVAALGGRARGGPVGGHVPLRGRRAGVGGRRRAGPAVRQRRNLHPHRARPGKALTDLVAGNATIDAVVTVTVPVTALPRRGPVDRAGRVGRGHEDGGEGDLVEVTGLAGTQPVLVSRRWLTATVEELRIAVRPGDCGVARADRPRPSSGWRHEACGQRRPCGCRFPGCAVAAVFCDLDHVRPWPTGHRHGQPGLPVPAPPPGQATTRLASGTGRRRHRDLDRPHRPGPQHRSGRRPHSRRSCATTRSTPTRPDARRSSGTSPPSSVLTTDMSATAATGSVPVGALPDGPHSSVEYRLEHLAATAPPTSTIAWRDERGAHRVEVTPARHDVRVRRRRPVPGHQSPRRRPGPTTRTRTRTRPACRPRHLHRSDDEHPVGSARPRPERTASAGCLAGRGRVEGREAPTYGDGVPDPTSTPPRTCSSCPAPTSGASSRR